VNPEILQWLNLLLIPVAAGVLSIHGRLAKLEAVQSMHGGRLEKLDGIKPA
jgi:hypothetical protein